MLETVGVFTQDFGKREILVLERLVREIANTGTHDSKNEAKHFFKAEIFNERAIFTTLLSKIFP